MYGALDPDTELAPFACLNDTNYHTWKIHMEAQLGLLERWDVVSGEDKRPVVDEDASEEVRTVVEKATQAWKHRDIEAKLIITAKLDRLQRSLVMKCESAKEIWDTLRRVHLETGVGWKVFGILLAMRDRRYVDGMSMHEHTSAFMMDRMKLEDLKADFGDEALAMMILSSIPAGTPALDVIVFELLNSVKPGKRLRSEDVAMRLNDYDGVLAFLKMRREERSGRKAPAKAWCTYHRTDSHNTSECRAVARNLSKKQS